MPVVDFRFRPPTEDFKRSMEAVGRIMGVETNYGDSTLEQCVGRMREHEIIGVVPGRDIPDSRVSNDHVKAIVDGAPDRFVPIAGVDPSAGNRRKCQDEIERTVRGLGFKGIHFDHGFLSPPLYADDRRLYPVYAQCEDLRAIVILQMGPTAGADLSYTSPLSIQRVAKDFPNLQIVLAHGCFPYVTEITTIMWRSSNIWLSPDNTVYMPGGQHYVEAANKAPWVRNRTLYASAYPAADFVQSLERFKKLGWNDKALERVLYDNAAELLGLPSRGS